jgi:hypothetical protein
MGTVITISVTVGHSVHLLPTKRVQVVLAIISAPSDRKNWSPSLVFSALPHHALKKLRNNSLVQLITA